MAVTHKKCPRCGWSLPFDERGKVIRHYNSAGTARCEDTVRESWGTLMNKYAIVHTVRHPDTSAYQVRNGYIPEDNEVVNGYLPQTVRDRYLLSCMLNMTEFTQWSNLSQKEFKLLSQLHENPPPTARPDKFTVPDLKFAKSLTPQQERAAETTRKIFPNAHLAKK